MKRRLAILLAVLALMLCSCGRMLVEDAAVQVGSPSVKQESIGR